jgi:hypothetical protein
VFRSNELTYLRYEEFVDGPDVTLVSATVNGSKDYLSEIDFKSYELSSFNLTLKDSTILAMVKID